MQETYVLEKYKAIQNEDGNWVIFDVPIFAEESRNGIDFDEEWLNQAVQLAQERWNESRYMPPYHEEHNSLKPNESKIVRKNLGLFLPKSVQRGEIEGEEKAIVIADILVSPDVFEAIKAGKYPYLSIETGNPMKPEIASLAALPSRAPEVKQSPLMVAPVHFSEEYQRYQFSENKMEAQQFALKFLNKEDESRFNDLEQKIKSLQSRIVSSIASIGGKSSVLSRLKEMISKRETVDFGTEKQIKNKYPEIAQMIQQYHQLKMDQDVIWTTNASFAEGSEQDTQQFGVADLAKKIAGSWGSVKSKIATNPKYRGLVDAIASNSIKGPGGSGATLDADNVASWLRSIPVDQIMQLTNFLFSEESEMGKEQFGLIDNIKSVAGAVKNKLAEKESDEDFYKRSRESRGFAEGDSMDKEQFTTNVASNPNKGDQVKYNGDVFTYDGTNWDNGKGRWMTRQSMNQNLTMGVAQEFAEDDANPEQMEGEGESPVDQITALLSGASDEILAQILQLLQGAGGEIQAAESDPAPVNQFAENRRGNLVSQPVQMALNLMNSRIKKMESEREKEKAIHFAEQRLGNVSQKSAIMKVLKGKPAHSVKELTEFAAQFAGKDPSNLDENDLSNDTTPSEVKELMSEYAPSEKALVCQFAEEWERSYKTLPLKRFVQIRVKGYQPNKKQNSQNN